MIAHWDEAPKRRADAGPMGAEWQDLGRAAGTLDVGLRRIRIDPGKLSTPPHAHSREEEIVFVLGGSGLLWQEGATCELRPRDCVVHRGGADAHTLVGGPDGLDVLVFGPRQWAEAGYLPRSGNLWVGRWAVKTSDRHPWEDEAALGPLELPEPGARPQNAVSVDDVAGDFGGHWKRLGAEAGAQRSGLVHATLGAGDEGADPHLHTAEEEVYVILEGEGTLELWPGPRAAADGRTREEQPVRAGHVLAFPPGGGVAHYVRSDAGMTYLAYGTRNAGDVCFYPRENLISFRGVGLLARLEHVVPWDEANDT